MTSDQLGGGTVSCGCYRKEMAGTWLTTHGKARKGQNRSRVYRIWNGAKCRCTKPSQPHYERYGGRGIEFCERWMKFENFLADMGEPPTDKHSLDRIDNDGHYEPKNCRWATQLEQAHNKRLPTYAAQMLIKAALDLPDYKNLSEAEQVKIDRVRSVYVEFHDILKALGRSQEMKLARANFDQAIKLVIQQITG